jgi:hypothetical protein
VDVQVVGLLDAADNLPPLVEKVLAAGGAHHKVVLF